MRKLDKKKLALLPEWAQRHITNMDNSLRGTTDALRIASAERGKAEQATRNIQRELDKANLRIRELESR